MKVAIGYHIQEGPWGGGNQFAKALTQTLRDERHQVCFSLDEPDIDIILLTEVRGRSPTGSFNAGSILRYLQFTNPEALVVHRINECDERKGTKNLNAFLMRANYVADHTIFVGSWLRKLPLWREGTSSVLLNGSDPNVFKARLAVSREDRRPLRLVTHHWGAHWMKGRDVYAFLDRLICKAEWRERIQFTYIGNQPDGLVFSEANHLPPLSGSDLASELASHHVYITGSMNEPGAMHPVEGALSGLPLIYRDSGSMSEYCGGFGIAFDCIENLPAAIESMIDEYDHWKKAVDQYPNTSEQMCGQYIEVFENLLRSRNEIVEQRRIWREVGTVLRNQIAI